MGPTLTITADPRAISMAESIRRLAGTTPLFLVSHRAFRDLARELGSADRAARHIAEVAVATGKPILVNQPTGGGRSATIAVAPPTWTEEKLQGWIAGHHQVLERQFGTIERVGPFPRGPRFTPRQRRRRKGRR
jgi:hypothetical protein